MYRGNSKSGELARAIRREYIDSGPLGPGDRLPPIRELQRRYGASSTSVAHALSLLEGQGLVSKQAGRGCYLTGAGEDPERGGHLSIGLVIPMVRTSNIQMEVVLGVERQCTRSGYNVMLRVSHLTYEEERLHVHSLIGAGCGAIVVYPTHRNASESAADYLASEDLPVPVVAVDLASEEYRTSKVVFDNYRAGYDMTRLLLEHGHTRIAFMRFVAPEGPLFHRSNADRYEGYLQALLEAGVSAREQDLWPIVHSTERHRDDIRRHLGRLKDEEQPATAVLCTEDLLAVVAFHEARELGIRVPAELQLAGFDSLPVAEAVHPRFPSTRADFIRAGEMAAQTALRHLDGTLRQPVNYTLPVSVVPNDIQQAGP